MSARSLARRLNQQRTLPQRLLRELHWLARDLRDIHDELKRGAAKHQKQSEMTDKDIAGDGY